MAGIATAEDYNGGLIERNAQYIQELFPYFFKCTMQHRWAVKEVMYYHYEDDCCSQGV